MSTAVKRPELLAPARDFEQLEMVLTYGADAVYLAGTRYGMRAVAGTFTPERMVKAVKDCREKGARVYVTCNNVMTNDDARDLPEFLQELEQSGVDAVIVADIGVLALAKRYAPKLEIHISTQAGVFNYMTAQTFYDLGASRVILAREVPVSEIEEIRANTPDSLQLEAFVHGSMCVSVSGRCLISQYMTGRDANRGRCAQPCRWKYHLMEEQRPGEYYEISEDGGTFILNSRDLCMIDHLDKLYNAGVSSFKIEGRMKSGYYAAVVTNAYRHGIDALVKGETLCDVWREELSKVSHREYSTGFYLDKDGPGQYYKDSMYFSECDVAAVVESCSPTGEAQLTQRNKITYGDTLELLTPNGKPVRFTLTQMTDESGVPISTAPHPMMRFKMQLPGFAPRNSILRVMKD